MENDKKAVCMCSQQMFLAQGWMYMWKTKAGMQKATTSLHSFQMNNALVPENSEILLSNSRATTYRLRTAALGQMQKVRELSWVCSLGGRSVDGSIQTVAVPAHRDSKN